MKRVAPTSKKTNKNTFLLILANMIERKLKTMLGLNNMYSLHLYLSILVPLADVGGELGVGLGLGLPVEHTLLLVLTGHTSALVIFSTSLGSFLHGHPPAGDLGLEFLVLSGNPGTGLVSITTIITIIRVIRVVRVIIVIRVVTIVTVVSLSGTCGVGCYHGD